MFDPVSLDEALVLLGSLLANRGHHFEVVAIGGGALQLIGVIERPTKDLDLVALLDGRSLIPIEKGLPQPLVDAVVDVARVLDIASDWMNGGPKSLLEYGLPVGFSIGSNAANMEASASLSPVASTRFISSSMQQSMTGLVANTMWI